MYVEVEVNLVRHPKTMRVARALTMDPNTIVGYLIAMWGWVAEFAPDGDITRFDASDIASATQCDCDANTLLDALVNCGPGGSKGFIERDDDGMRVHDWMLHTGRTIAKRHADMLRKRETRSTGRPAPESTDVQRTSDGHPADVQESVTNATPDVHGMSSVICSDLDCTKDTPCKSPKGDGDNPAQAARKALSEKVGGLFDRFYGAFPRKVNPALAARSFGKVFAGLGDADVDALAVRIGVGLKAYKAYVAGKDIEYVQHPSSWLNARAWESEYGATTPKAVDVFEEARMMPQCRTPRELTAPSMPADLAALDAENADALWEAARMMS